MWEKTGEGPGWWMVINQPPEWVRSEAKENFLSRATPKMKNKDMKALYFVARIIDHCQTAGKNHYNNPGPLISVHSLR